MTEEGRTEALSADPKYVVRAPLVQNTAQHGMAEDKGRTTINQSTPNTQGKAVSVFPPPVPPHYTQGKDSPRNPPPNHSPVPLLPNN